MSGNTGSGAYQLIGRYTPFALFIVFHAVMVVQLVPVLPDVLLQTLRNHVGHAAVLHIKAPCSRCNSK